MTTWVAGSVMGMWQTIRMYVLFQAEDGIRYLTVTGVQTCALPICSWLAVDRIHRAGDDRRAPVRERERGAGERPFRRRPDRRGDHRPLDDQDAARHLAPVGDALEGKRQGPADHRARARRALRVDRYHPTRWVELTRYGAARGRQGRCAALGG